MARILSAIESCNSNNNNNNSVQVDTSQTHTHNLATRARARATKRRAPRSLTHCDVVASSDVAITAATIRANRQKRREIDAHASTMRPRIMCVCVCALALCKSSAISAPVVPHVLATLAHSPLSSSGSRICARTCFCASAALFRFGANPISAPRRVARLSSLIHCLCRHACARSRERDLLYCDIVNQRRKKQHVSKCVKALGKSWPPRQS